MIIMSRTGFLCLLGHCCKKLPILVCVFGIPLENLVTRRGAEVLGCIWKRLGVCIVSNAWITIHVYSPCSFRWVAVLLLLKMSPLWFPRPASQSPLKWCCCFSLTQLGCCPPGLWSPLAESSSRPSSGNRFCRASRTRWCHPYSCCVRRCGSRSHSDWSLCSSCTNNHLSGSKNMKNHVSNPWQSCKTVTFNLPPFKKTWAQRSACHGMAVCCKVWPSYFHSVNFASTVRMT